MARRLTFVVALLLIAGATRAADPLHSAIDDLDRSPADPDMKGHAVVDK